MMMPEQMPEQKQLKTIVDDRVWLRVENPVEDRAWHRVWDRVDDRIAYRVVNLVRARVWRDIKKQ